MFSINVTCHLSFPFVCLMMPMNDFKVLTMFSKISFLFLIFWYIFRKTFNLNKVFSFSKANMFTACHLSKIYLRSQRKSWFYLAQNLIFRFKNIRFLFRKKEVFLENSTSWIFYFFSSQTCLLLATFLKLILKQKKKCGFIWPKTFNVLFKKHSNFYSEKRVVPWKQLFLNFKNIKINNLQLYKNLWKINMNMNFFTDIFQGFCLLSRNTSFKEHLWVDASVYFNSEVLQGRTYFL